MKFWSYCTHAIASFLMKQAGDLIYCMDHKSQGINLGIVRYHMFVRARMYLGICLKVSKNIYRKVMYGFE